MNIHLVSPVALVKHALQTHCACLLALSPEEREELMRATAGDMQAEPEGIEILKLQLAAHRKSKAAANN